MAFVMLAGRMQSPTSRTKGAERRRASASFRLARWPTAQITVLPGYHQCILVQHGNYFTLYAKMKRVDVKAGDKVSTGQVLGTVDTIAGETVFHFEIWDDRTIPQDPERWLRPR